jgi:glyceraldehyde 3-phosphate dehydrogenase
VPNKKTSKDEINDAVKKAAANGRLKGILGYTDQPLVSHDFNHDARSSILDSLETQVMEGGEFVRVLSWYDNEWGFSNRMVDTSVAISKTL